MDQPRVLGTILGSFFVVFLPLCYLELVPNDVKWLPYLAMGQAVGLGVSHFFITLALYANKSNLSYFNRSSASRAIYFGVPVACFGFFAIAGTLGLSDDNAFFGLYFFPALRVLDFVHVGRQSFGVTQLLKRSISGVPKGLRTMENLLFAGLALLQWQTFLSGGRFLADAPSATVPAALVGLLFVAVLSGYLRLAEATGSIAGVFRPLIYVVLQTASAAAAVYETRLYLLALTMHYVEYHVLMAPRIFTPAPTVVPASRDASPAGRNAPSVRTKVVIFYILLLVAVVLFEARAYAPVELPTSAKLMVHLFDGIFVFHYFIEAFVWKFNNPFYRDGLVPLYLGSGPVPASNERKTAGPSARLPSLLELACVSAISLAGAWALLQSDVLGTAFRRRVVDPMLAEQYVEWGIDLADRGDLPSAIVHFERARERDPENQRAGQAISQARSFARARSERSEGR